MFNEDPSSTQGAIGIYAKLHQYVPVLDGKPYTTVVYGDGLSCERGNDAQCARTNGLTPTERLDGLEPAAQEFYKEMILLQDLYDDLYSFKSCAARGTMCQVRKMFNFRQVKPDISDNVSHAWELMSVCTETYSCLLKMEMQKIKDSSSRPYSAPDGIEKASDEEKSKYFEEICSGLVSYVWYKLDTEALKHDDGTSLQMFCCGEDKHDAVIGCETPSRCTKGEYLHYSCVNVNPDNTQSVWFCSDECRQQQSPYSYCTCKTYLGSDEPMIGCSAEHLCTKVEWCHMKCLGSDPEKTIKGDWFCSDKYKRRWKGKGRKQKGQDTSTTRENDKKRDYSVALLWRCLILLCRRDTVREADGDAMMAYWKMDLV